MHQCDTGVSKTHTASCVARLSARLYNYIYYLNDAKIKQVQSFLYFYILLFLITPTDSKEIGCGDTEGRDIQAQVSDCGVS